MTTTLSESVTRIAIAECTTMRLKGPLWAPCSPTFEGATPTESTGATMYGTRAGNGRGTGDGERMEHDMMERARGKAKSEERKRDEERSIISVGDEHIIIDVK